MTPEERAACIIEEASEASGGAAVEVPLLLDLIAAALTAERERCAKVAESVEHPNEDEWDWNKADNRPKGRAAFYQNHIVHAWKQCRIKIAAAIRRGT